MYSILICKNLICFTEKFEEISLKKGDVIKVKYSNNSIILKKIIRNNIDINIDEKISNKFRYNSLNEFKISSILESKYGVDITKSLERSKKINIILNEEDK